MLTSHTNSLLLNRRLNCVKKITCINAVNSEFIFFLPLVGKGKTQVIAGCRQAIKNNNVNGLFKIIRAGSL